MSENDVILKVNGLKTYFYQASGVSKAVDGVSFSLRQGTTMGIVGESGSGKSVTSASVMRLMPAKTGKIVDGSIIFDGVDIRNLSESQMEKFRGDECCMIFQNPMTCLNPVYTIGNQLVEALKAHDKNVSKEDAEKQAMKMLEEVGINNVEKRMKQYPHELSGGMRQRVMIAMGLICHPKLLIADEPTTALDVTIQAQILELMKKLQKQNHMGIIFITHNLGVVAEICDRCMVVYAGEKIEEGSLEDIFDHREHPYTKGLFDSLPNLQDDSPRLKPIPGLMSNPMDLPSYCSFYDRCSVKCDSCKNSNPKLIEITPGHTVACSRIAQAQKEAK